MTYATEPLQRALAGASLLVWATRYAPILGCGHLTLDPGGALDVRVSTSRISFYARLPGIRLPPVTDCAVSTFAATLSTLCTCLRALAPTPEVDLSFLSDHRRLVLSAGPTTYRIHTWAAEDYPVDCGDPDDGTLFSAEATLRMLTGCPPLLPLVHTGSFHPFQTGVWLTTEGGCAVVQHDRMVWHSMQPGVDPTGSVRCVSPLFFQALKRVIPPGASPVLSWTGTGIRAVLGDMRLEARWIDATLPDLTRVLTAPYQGTVSVRASDLGDALQIFPARAHVTVTPAGSGGLLLSHQTPDQESTSTISVPGQGSILAPFTVRRSNIATLLVGLDPTTPVALVLAPQPDPTDGWILRVQAPDHVGYCAVSHPTPTTVTP